MSNVNHPDHYVSGQYECIDVMQSVFGTEATLNFCLLNAFKYLWRNGKKETDNNDVEKAEWYLNKMTEIINRVNDDDNDPYKYGIHFGDVYAFEASFEDTKDLMDFLINKIENSDTKDVEEEVTEKDEDIEDFLRGFGKKETEDEYEEIREIAEEVGKKFYMVYESLMKAGFDKNQAYGLTREWFGERITDAKNS